MPNEAGVGQRPWTEYVTTIDAVEAATGYDLFARVPDDVESVIESRRVLP
jgi:endonuclease G